MTTPITVLIADDQDLVRAGFTLVVDAQPDMRVVAQAATGQQAVTLAAAHRPDVILMDIRMPDTDGIEATRRILATIAPPPKVLALTTYDSDDYATRVLAAGASGFILKDATAEGLAAAIRGVHQGSAVIAPSTTRRLVDHLTATADPPYARPGQQRPGQQRPGRPAAAPAFTDRERDVLTLVVAGASNAEIARTLHLAEVTVKTHVGRILAKLGVRDRVQIVIWAYRHGRTPE